MEKFISPELKNVLLFLGIGFVGLSTLMGLAISRLRGAFKPYSKQTIVYLLLYCLGFVIAALLINLPLGSYSSHYIVFQLLFTALGILHTYTCRYYLKWSRDDSFWADLLFTIVIMLAGAACFLLIYRVFNKEGMDWYMATAALFFAVPFLVNETFKRAMRIPPKVFKQWFYPVHLENELIPDETKLKNLLVISFEFRKKPNDIHYTNFRAKAPADMEMGELFYFFINDYNDRHPQERIVYADDKLGQPYGWIFYKKPKWYTIFTKYIDTDRTIFINNIRENDIIVCHRNV
ncbi:MAG: hypothetical protein IT249_05000 [Chitinophagaceae bacterium]|nr:hypothetical protein [Chitinophagaceae bacterium]